MNIQGLSCCGPLTLDVVTNLTPPGTKTMLAQGRRGAEMKQGG